MKKHGVSPEWLEAALFNGMQIHHRDGDHKNDDPKNLVLIFCGDHGSFHGAKTFSGKSRGVWVTAEQLKREREQAGKAAYEAVENGVAWELTGVNSAQNKAKAYAIKNGKPWPIKKKLKTDGLVIQPIKKPKKKSVLSPVERMAPPSPPPNRNVLVATVLAHMDTHPVKIMKVGDRNADLAFFGKMR